MTRMRLAVLLIVLAAGSAVEARIGGGDTYSGSSSSSSSGSSYSSSGSGSSFGSGSSGGSGYSSGGDVSVGFMLFVFFGIFFVAGLMNPNKVKDLNLTISSATPARAELMGQEMAATLRQFDPNASEIVFTDFCYSLFARVHEARGRGRLDDYAPYVSAPVREGMQGQAADVSSVDQIVIGSFSIVGLRGMDGPLVETDVEFEANYTEETAAGARRWYVRERWTLERARDLLSPAPEQARADHCPKCGAPLETRTDGACLHCGTVVSDGSFQWFVRSITVAEKQEQPPRIGGSSEERGTERPTVYQPWIARKQAAFLEQHPGFTWEAFEERVRHVANELQTAWTARDWQRARAYETGPLFQMHRYWIDEYLRQGLRNFVDDYETGVVDVVKVASDAFYDAITVRLFASGVDYTVDNTGELFFGSKRLRKWSEYWTFIRGRAGAAADAKLCPNCGSPREDGQTVICAYCGGQIVTGEFPWILSRIEQDEAYRG